MSEKEVKMHSCQWSLGSLLNCQRQRKGQAVKVTLLSVLILLGWPDAWAQSDEFSGLILGRAAYRNKIADIDGPRPEVPWQPKAIGLVAGGHSSDVGGGQAPQGGGFVLGRSRIGQAVNGGIIRRPDFDFGEEIIATLAASRGSELAAAGVAFSQQPIVDATEKVFWVPGEFGGQGRLFVTDVGFVTVTWRRLNGDPTLTEQYLVGDRFVARTIGEVDVGRDHVRFFQTHYSESGLPTGAPDVGVPEGLLIEPLFSRTVPAPTPHAPLDSVRVLGGQILSGYPKRAKIAFAMSDRSGFLGLELVELVPYLNQSALVSDGTNAAIIGEFLEPMARPLNASSPYLSTVFDPLVGGRSMPFAHQLDLPQDEVNHGRILSVRPSASSKIEVFWRRHGLLVDRDVPALDELVWPYEMHRYSSQWPSDFAAKRRYFYHTHDRDGARLPSPQIDFTDRVSGVEIHHNPNLPPIPADVNNLTEDDRVKMWKSIGGQKLLNVKIGIGKVLLHYVNTTGLFAGVEYVDVQHYDPDHDIPLMDIGDQLLANGSRAHVDDQALYSAFVARGARAPEVDEDLGPYVYQHKKPGVAFNDVFAIRSSTSDKDIELFWMEPGFQLTEVLWPFEMRRYRAAWPDNDSDKVQVFVRGHRQDQLGKVADISERLNPTLMDFQQPKFHADPDLTRGFSSRGVGRSLMRFETGSPVGSEGVFFQVVRSVIHDDGAEFDLVEHGWEIGKELWLDEQAYHELLPEYPTDRGFLFVNRDKSLAVPPEFPNVGAPDREDHHAPEIYEETGQIFGVNEGKMEVWWSNVREYGGIKMQWPSKAKRYQLEWPTNPDAIIVSSRKGSAWRTALNRDFVDDPGFIDSGSQQDPQIYFENDPSQPGYNPNDEHALIADAGKADAVFALRNDLGLPTTSVPYVLLQWVKPADSRYAFRVYNVISETLDLPFRYDIRAGTQVQPPFPLSLFSGCENSDAFRLATDNFVRDRKGAVWAFAAGDDGGTSEFWMRFQYPFQEGWYIPPSKIPFGVPQINGLIPLGTCLPWLDQLFFGPAATNPGEPINVRFTVHWPDNIPAAIEDELGESVTLPELRIGETLVRPKHGLPDISLQSSVGILYQQSVRNGGGASVKLIDPTIDPTVEAVTNPDGSEGLNYRVPLPVLPPDIETVEDRGKVFFADLPPQLRNRIWYQPASESLHMRGEYREVTAGEEPYYLLLNILTSREKKLLEGISTKSTTLAAWRAAVATLGEVASRVVEVVDPSDPFDSLALTAGLAEGSGYVSLIFGNGNETVTPPADPVSVEVIRVNCPPFKGDIKVIESENPFDEKLTLRHSGDFAGLADSYVFEWRYHPPVNGLPPSFEDKPAEEWFVYSDVLPHPDNEGFLDPNGGHIGALDITIEGASLFTLTDNYFICRYRPRPDALELPLPCLVNPDGSPNPIGFSDWTSPMLAEGWIKRVLAKIDPFEQRIRDYENLEIDTIVSMISQAGPPPQGNVPLNNEGALNFGLLEIYQTVLERGRKLSIDGAPPISYGPANDALLLVTSRLAQLYMLLGNEAFADAADPTIGFGTDDRQYGNQATSIHVFMNQVPTLLDEELALLRGRDDRFLPTIDTYPVFNRLMWNFSRDITGGEVAYAINYGIKDVSGSTSDVDGKDGRITEEDAKVLYPQGHGDAWGHYLSAIKKYFKLLQHPNFDWVPRPEAVIVGDVPLSVDYFDERLFAKTAAARAKTGVEVVGLAYRKGYLEDSGGLHQAYDDHDEDRAWGMSEWASRAGQGAFLDWVVGNAVLPQSYGGGFRVTDFTLEALRDSVGVTASVVGAIGLLEGSLYPSLEALENAVKGRPAIGEQPAIIGVLTNVITGEGASEEIDRIWGIVSENIEVPGDPPAEGLQVIDRTTVLELREIPAAYAEIESQLDQADRGLNPLGLARNTVPFDISPRELDEGLTHFEQIYQRAATALNNAVTVFDRAANSAQLLRRQADSVDDFQQAVEDREFDFTTRLVELYGTPYPEDIGPLGSYPTDYYGPDYLHFDYIDSTGFEARVLPRDGLDEDETLADVSVNLRSLNVMDDGTFTELEQEVTFYLGEDGWVAQKPRSWQAPRQITGEIQRALTQLVESRIRLGRGLTEYDNLLYQIEEQARLLSSQHHANVRELEILGGGIERQGDLNDWITTSRQKQLNYRMVGRQAILVQSALAEFFPKVFGVSNDATAPFRGSSILIGASINELMTVLADNQAIAELSLQQEKEITQAINSLELTKLRQPLAIEQQFLSIKQLISQETIRHFELQSQAQGVVEAANNYQTALARGERLRTELARFRRQTAAQVQEYRYKDMAFRIFRNDAIQKYRAQFDLAGQYAYLAAKAYDYETNLDPFCGGQGALTTDFINGIIRARSLGDVVGGVPMPGPALGDPGLADSLARLFGNFNLNLKGQLGINNPDRDLNRFSLRQEYWQFGPGAQWDALWREQLNNAWVDDLFAVDAFRRYCLPFASQEDLELDEGGFVFGFSSSINFGENFFGKPLRGGDSTFDSSRYATKIRRVGVYFQNYDNIYGSGMSQTPQVYLVPIGQDIMRAPNCDFRIRSWRVLDQRIPLPFPLSATSLDSPIWIPRANSLRDWKDSVPGEFAEIRRHPSFRAYHDAANSELSETVNDTPLIGRSVWNTQWMLVIPAGTLHGNRAEAKARFIEGPVRGGERAGLGVSDIKLIFETTSYPGF